jgi:hypothetical protein
MKLERATLERATRQERSCQWHRNFGAIELYSCSAIGVHSTIVV